MNKKTEQYSAAAEALATVHRAREELAQAKVFRDLASVPGDGGTPLNSKYSTLQLQRRRRDDQSGERATVATSGLNDAVLRYIRDNEAQVLNNAIVDLSNRVEEAEAALRDAMSAFSGTTHADSAALVGRGYPDADYPHTR